MTEPIDPIDPDAPIVDDQPIPYRRGRPFGIRSDILQKLQDTTVTQRQVSDIVQEGFGHLAQMRGTLAEADKILEDAGILLEEARGIHATIPGIIEEGRGHVADALGHAEAASEHVSAAQTLVEEAEALVDEADGLNEDIKATFGQMQLLRQQATQSVRVASGQAAQAIVHAGEAHRFVEQARSYNTQIAAHIAEAQSAVEEGRGHVADALASADAAGVSATSALAAKRDVDLLVDEADAILVDARALHATIQPMIDQGAQHVTNAKGHADRADQAVTDAGVAKTAAETALNNATNLLADIDGEGTDFPTAVTQVLGAHNEVLTKHGEVITKHGEAITAASDASRDAGLAADKALEVTGTLTATQALHTEVLTKHGQAIRAAGSASAMASMSAMQANETARSAALAADSALNASNANTDAIKAMNSANTARDTAITKAADAAGDAGKAAKSLTDAVTALEKSQGILENNQIIQTDINTKHGQAIKAAAGAAGQAAMAAMQAMETGRSAALAADKALEAADKLTTVQGLHGDVLGKHGDVLDKHSTAIGLAGDAAGSALEAVEASNLAQQTGWAKIVGPSSKGDDYMHMFLIEGNSAAIIREKIPADGPMWSGEVFAKAYYENNTVQSAYATVPMVGDMSLGGGSTVIKHVEVDYRRNHGIPRKRRQANDIGWQLPTNNEWHQFDTGEPWKISMTQTAAVTVLFRVGWDAAGYNGGYSLQARVNNVGVVTVTNNGFGPQYTWQGDGFREQVLARSGNAAINVPAGQELTFWVRRDRVGATTAPQERKIRHFDLTAVWIDPPA